MKNKEEKKPIDNLENQKVDAEKVTGGKTQPFDEFTAMREEEKMNFASDEKSSLKGNLRKKASTVFSRKTDAKK